MATIINASNSTGLTLTSDLSGDIALQTNGVAAISVDTTQRTTLANSATATAFIPSGSTVPSSGMYLIAANTLGISTSSAERLRIESGGSFRFITQGSDYAANIGADGASYFYRPTNNAGFGVLHFQSNYYSTAGLCAYIQANGAYNNLSDARLKKNITPTSYGLDTVCNLNPVDFNWKQEDDGDIKSCGFIAQEVEKIIPQAVTTLSSDVPSATLENQKMLSTATLIPALTKAIQELNAKVDAQAIEIAALKARGA